QSKGVCNETDVRPGRGQFGAIGSPGHSRRPPRDSTAHDLFGEHTFFLDRNGLNIVEPAEAAAGAAAQSAKVVNLASWSDDDPTRLELHKPDAQDIVNTFQSRH